MGHLEAFNIALYAALNKMRGKWHNHSIFCIQSWLKGYESNEDEFFHGWIHLNVPALCISMNWSVIKQLNGSIGIWGLGIGTCSMFWHGKFHSESIDSLTFCHNVSV